MEEVLIKQKKFKQVMLPIDITKKLENLNKGSYSEAIRYLLNLSNPNSKIKIDDIEDRLDKIEAIIEKIIKFNNLKC